MELVGRRSSARPVPALSSPRRRDRKQCADRDRNGLRACCSTSRPLIPRDELRYPPTRVAITGTPRPCSRATRRAVLPRSWQNEDVCPLQRLIWPPAPPFRGKKHPRAHAPQRPAAAEPLPSCTGDDQFSSDAWERASARPCRSSYRPFSRTSRPYNKSRSGTPGTKACAPAWHKVRNRRRWERRDRGRADKTADASASTSGHGDDRVGRRSVARTKAVTGDVRANACGSAPPWTWYSTVAPQSLATMAYARSRQ